MGREHGGVNSITNRKKCNIFKLHFEIVKVITHFVDNFLNVTY